QGYGGQVGGQSVERSEEVSSSCREFSGWGWTKTVQPSKKIQRRKGELRRVVFGNFAHVQASLSVRKGECIVTLPDTFKQGRTVGVGEEIGGSRPPNQIDYAKCICPNDKIRPQRFHEHVTPIYQRTTAM